MEEKNSAKVLPDSATQKVDFDFDTMYRQMRQKRKSLEEKTVINFDVRQLIKYADGSPCSSCGVETGQLHKKFCHIEKCSICHQQYISCDHDGDRVPHYSICT
jgi:hypothetical protein